jgi:Leucine-rich repeat (LRR) protein
LKSLRLWNNKITDISVLKGLTNLRWLDLSGNPLTEEQIAELQAALPDCTIYF